MRNRSPSLTEYILTRHLQLMLNVDIGCRNKRVDARALRASNCLPCGLDIGAMRSCKSSDNRPLNLLRNCLYSLRITMTGDWETGLNHVDTKPSELLRYFKLLDCVQRDARRLLTVSEGRVKDQYAIAVLH